MKVTPAFIFIQGNERGVLVMTPKLALCSAILAVPLIIAGAGPSAADVDAEFGFGFGSPYYGMSPYDPYYGYGLADPNYGYGLADPYYGYGLADPYYGYGLTDPYYGYGLTDPYVGSYGGEFDEDAVDEVIEPAAAPPDPASCVKSNVRNFKNACPN
jgi:hypothetical protein